MRATVRCSVGATTYLADGGYPVKSLEPSAIDPAVPVTHFPAKFETFSRR